MTLRLVSDTLMRESIEARIADLLDMARAECAAADVLEGHAEDHRRNASRIQHEAEELEGLA